MAHDSQARPTDIMTRTDVLWSRKWLILLAVLVVGAASGLFAATRTPEFEAQATVRVSLLQTQDVGAQNAIGANEYAAQYAQIVTSEPVLKLAARESGVSVSEMKANSAATPLNKYNVIGISSTFGSAAEAGRVASALAKAIVAYVEKSSASAIKSSTSAVSTQRKSLDDAITAAQQDVSRATGRNGSGAAADANATSLESARSYLASLVALRQNLYLAPVREFLQSQPVLTVLNSPEAGSQQPQRVVAYTAVGAIVGGVIAAELFLLLAQSQGRRRR